MLKRHIYNLVSRQKLTILIYHRVLEAQDAFFEGDIEQSEFSELMKWLHGFCNFVSLEDGIEKLKRQELPSNAVAITFDDGYRDNAEIAFPILQKLHIPMTVFVATGFLDGGCMWNDSIIEAFRRSSCLTVDLRDCGIGQYDLFDETSRLKARSEVVLHLKYLAPGKRDEMVKEICRRLKVERARNLMMTPDQVKFLSNSGVTIGAHTVNHYVLSTLTLEEAEYEIVQSKKDLEKLTGKEVNTFAYPNGKPGVDFTRDHVALLENSGFSLAVTTEWGVSQKGVSLFQVPRFTPWSRKRSRFFSQMVKNCQRTRYTTI